VSAEFRATNSAKTFGYFWQVFNTTADPHPPADLERDFISLHSVYRARNLWQYTTLTLTSFCARVMNITVLLVRWWRSVIIPC
jgi:hypothetical protein